MTKRLSILVLSVWALLGAGVGLGADGPDRGLQARINSAAPGATVEVGPGVYAGPIVIDKPLRLIGRGRPVIDGGGNGDIVEIKGTDVVLTGFVIRGTGTSLDHENVGVRVLAARATIEDNVLEDVLFGIDLKASCDTVVRGNRIGGKNLDIARRGDGLRLWRSDRCLVEGNVITDGRDAILWYSSNVMVRGNTALRCRYGFHLMFSNDVTLEDNDLTENSVGVYFMYSSGLVMTGNRLVRNRGPSGYGVGLKDTEHFRVEHNVFVGNRVGIYIDNAAYTASQAGEFVRNTVAFNDIGMTFLPAVRGIVVRENNFVDNFEQVSIQGRGELTGNEFAVNGRGNFWSDYTGYDLDGDGVGELEYAPQRLFENLIDREPTLRILLFSPAHQAVEFIGRALPAVQPEPKFDDPFPLVRPVEFAASRAVAARGGGMGAVGAGLVALATLIAAGARGGWSVRRRRAGACGPRPALGGAS